MRLDFGITGRSLFGPRLTSMCRVVRADNDPILEKFLCHFQQLLQSSSYSLQQLQVTVGVAAAPLARRLTVEAGGLVSNFRCDNRL